MSPFPSINCLFSKIDQTWRSGGPVPGIRLKPRQCCQTLDKWDNFKSVPQSGDLLCRGLDSSLKADGAIFHYRLLYISTVSRHLEPVPLTAVAAVTAAVSFGCKLWADLIKVICISPVVPDLRPRPQIRFKPLNIKSENLWYKFHYSSRFTSVSTCTVSTVLVLWFS